MAKCSSKNKTGKPCRAPAVSGTKVCRVHTPGYKPDLDRLHTPEAVEKARATRLAQRVPRELDLLAQKLNDNADEIVDQLLEIARNAQKAVVVHGNKDTPGWVEMVPDDELRLKAISAIYDRIHGRPGQAVKISGDDDKPPVRVAPEKSEDRAAKVADILARQGALPNHGGRRRREPGHVST